MTLREQVRLRVIHSPLFGLIRYYQPIQPMGGSGWQSGARNRVATAIEEGTNGLVLQLHY